jgi:hypothetical protein
LVRRRWHIGLLKRDTAFSAISILLIQSAFRILHSAFAYTLAAAIVAARAMMFRVSGTL